jgi:uncharacterized protein
MSEQSNVEHVEREYAAFLDDDVAAVLEMSAPDIEYRYPDVEGPPYGGAWRGLEEVRRFFAVHDDTDEVLELRPTEMVARGDRVLVLGSFRARAASTGREWATDFVHVHTVRDGKTRRFESYFDTAACLRAHGRLPLSVAPSGAATPRAGAGR